MADTSKTDKEAPSNPRGAPAQRASKTKSRQAEREANRVQSAAVTQRRVSAKKQREAERQRRLMVAVGAAVGLALVALLVGIIYDQLWVPSRPIAVVNEVTLTRSDYWQQARRSIAQEIAQNMQLLALFQNEQQLSSQFAGRSPGLNQQVAILPTLPEDPTVITGWQEYQLLLQRARDDLGIEVTADEVNQQIATDLGPIFLPASPEPVLPLTDTATLTGTAAVTSPATLNEPEALTSTDELTATATETETETETVAGDLPFELPTPIPTNTPRPTPDTAASADEVPLIVEEVYNRYTVELELALAEPALTRDDFRQALEQQYRRQILDERVRAALVPDDTFDESDDPERIAARHILLRVEAPEAAAPASPNGAAADPEAATPAAATPTATAAPDSPDAATTDAASTAAQDAAYARRLPLARDIARRLRAGDDFAELAAEFSDDPGSREQGGEIGFFDRDGRTDSNTLLAPAFVEAAFTLAVDEVSDPVRTRFGWHIIEVTDTVVPDREQQLRTARSEAFDTWQEDQRAQATLQRFPEPTATPTTDPALAPLDATPAPTYLPGPPTPEPPPPTPDPNLNLDGSGEGAGDGTEGGPVIELPPPGAP